MAGLNEIVIEYLGDSKPEPSSLEALSETLKKEFVDKVLNVLEQYLSRMNHGYREVSPRASVEDLAIQTVTTVFNKIDSYSQEGLLAGWIYSIARNNYLNERKKARKPEFNETHFAEHKGIEARDRPDVISASGIIEKKDEYAGLRAALGALSDAQRSVVELFIFGECGHAEIAEELGIPCGTSRSRLNAALKQLRLELEFYKG